MKFKNIQVRRAIQEDRIAIYHLYLEVAKIPGGIARTVSEITFEYIDRFLQQAFKAGIILVYEDSGQIVGEIHTYPLGPNIFSHVLGELTIVVSPNAQGKGVGRSLFKTLLHTVEREFPAINRVELMARESNEKAIRFYETLGFKKEGRLEDRVRSVNGGFEADIPMAWVRKL